MTDLPPERTAPVSKGRDVRPTALHRRAALALMGGAAASISGCSQSSRRDTAVVLTNWTDAELAVFHSKLDGVRLRAVRPSDGSDPIAWVERIHGADLLLGGPIDRHAALMTQGLALDPNGQENRGPELRSVSIATLGLAVRSGALDELVTASSLRLSDLATADGLVLGNLFREGLLKAPADDASFTAWYGLLASVFGGAVCVVRSTRSAVARVIDGRGAAATVCSTSTATAFGLRSIALSDVPPSLEGISILKTGTSNPAARRAWETLGSPVTPGLQSSRSSVADNLLADLLESTLIIAHPELRDAVRILAQPSLRGRSERDRAAHWMAQPPPWPPASVSELGGKSGGPSLIRALAEQLTPAQTQRSWLIESWRATPVNCDMRTLSAIANSDGGALASEPRFRAWLRAEWSAWARQRYRRAARLAEGPVTA